MPVLQPEELVDERVRDIECPVVRAPARPVGADNSRVDLRDRKIWVETPQAADREFFLIIHAACEKASAPVDLAVVQSGSRLIGVDELDQVEFFAVGIEEIEAVV